MSRNRWPEAALGFGIIATFVLLLFALSFIRRVRAKPRPSARLLEYGRAILMILGIMVAAAVAGEVINDVARITGIAWLFGALTHGTGGGL